MLSEGTLLTQRQQDLRGRIMSSYDIKCKIIEEELKSFWPEWHVVRRLDSGSFGDVFQIYRDNFGIRMDAALKVIQISDRMTIKGRDENRSEIPEAFRSEIQIMETLRGAPNIVSIEDFYYKKEGATSSLFVRMELLTSLQEVLSGQEENAPCPLSGRYANWAEMYAPL